GLVDNAAEVQQAAIEGLRTHNYPEAFDHLVRIFQNHSRLDVRRVVLEALGKIANFETAEFLWSLLRSDAEDEQERALRDAAGQVFVQILTSEWRAIFQSQLSTEPDEVQRRLGPILTGRRS
ncbi:MAG: HEAT repeat domain-containing protein, partial [Myxococcota bacterium]